MGLVNFGLLFISSVVGLGLIYIASKMRATRMDAYSRLQEQVRQTAEQMNSLVLRLQVVQESERKVLAAVLHDQVGQYLTGLNLNLKILQDSLPDASREVSKRLQESLQLVEETTRKIRDVMADLHPPVLEEYGLPAGIKWLCDDFCARTGIITRVQGDKNGGRLPARIETILYRHVQEALNNVVKHANATRVDVVLDWGGESFSLLV